MVFDKKLGKRRAGTFTRAVGDALNTGVRSGGSDDNTPHMFYVYVDDDVYSEVFDIKRVRQAAAAMYRGYLHTSWRVRLGPPPRPHIL